MAFTLFAGHTLKIGHLGGNDWGSNEANVINLCNVTARLIVLHEDLNVLHILEFHIAQIHRLSIL